MSAALNPSRTDPRPLGVAVAGLGFGETVHLPALRACPLTEPVALWHPRQERLDQATATTGLPGFTDFDALLADPRVDALVIATPPQPRAALAEQAIAAGKHLLLEKPVALDTARIEALQRQAMARGVCVAVDFEYRAVPAFLQLKALLASNPVGRPWLVKLDWLMGSRADAGRPWNWYSQRAAGGGVLGSLGTHAFDTLHWLFGPTRSLSASRSLAIPHRPLADGSGRLGTVDAEDIALLQLDLELAHGQRLPAQVSLASVTRPGRGYWIEIYGSEGSLVLGSPNQKDYVHGFSLSQAAAAGEAIELAPDPALAFPHTWPDGRVAPVQRLIQWWAEAALKGRPMRPGLSEAALSQRVCDLALVSADTGLRQLV
ncbi:MAG: Gfo/Idh/MocA family protein [Vulcanococcus sp.]